MTKYILAGGYVSKGPDGGQALCRELTDGFDTPVKILLVPFARETSNWQQTLDQDQAFFAAQLPDRPFTMQLADPDSFTTQVQWANAVWIKGGHTMPLMKLLSRDLSWRDHLDGKTIGGTSSGAYVLANSYHELDANVTGHGFGLVPVKVSAHWRSPTYNPDINWDRVKNELEAYDHTSELLLLAEGEYKVY